MKKVLFIHRSVGQNLIRDGHIYDLVSTASPSFEFADYNHNTDTLTTTKGESKPGLHFPGNDTKPKDYAALFSADGAKSYKPVHDMIADYDVIIIKSCYPNANITSDVELQKVMDNYQSLAGFFQGSSKRLIIVTTPPLRRLRTTSEAADRARKLAIWLTTTKLGTNVSVFDFFDLLADPKTNILKREYRHALFFDQHPNAKASQEVAPNFVEFLTGMMEL